MIPTELTHKDPTARRSRKLRLHLTTLHAAIISALVLTCSAWMSYTTADWTWFSRSGSLIVIIGIILTSSQVIENSRLLKQRRSHHDYNFNRDFAGDVKRRALDRSRSLEEELWENGLHGLYLLIFGTLIWGYGDLAGRFIG